MPLRHGHDDPVLGAPTQFHLHWPPTRADRKADLSPRVKATAVRDVAKIIFTLGILISCWRRTDSTTPAPELEPKLLSAS